MDVTLEYAGRSGIVSGPASATIALAPNLRRDRVAFNAALKHPLRFREAVGALHDVVVSDLRYQAKDRSAHDAYLAEHRTREASIRRGAASQTRATMLKESLQIDPAEVRRRCVSSIVRVTQVLKPMQ